MIQTSFLESEDCFLVTNMTNTAGLCFMFEGSRLKYNGFQVSTEDIA